MTRKASDLLGDLPAAPAPVEEVLEQLPLRAAVAPMLCLACGAAFTPRWITPIARCPACAQRDGALNPGQWERVLAEEDQPAAYRAALLRRRVDERPRADLRIPATYAEAQAIDVVETWATRDPAAAPLLLTGEAGRGKTHQACAALRLIAERRDEGRCELASATRLGRPGDRLDELSAAAAVALDDLGARLTPAALSAAYELIDYRIAHRLPLIVTTNLTLADLAKLDARLASRLASGVVLVLEGQDRRITRANP
jgi:hypothetical protein